MTKLLIIPPKRTFDDQGGGEYLDPRGARTHNGIDMACHESSGVLSASDGVVTKIGYPYDLDDEKKGHLRYVEIEAATGHRERYFYVLPTVAVGSRVKRGNLLGYTQGLTKVYPGITDHFHFEVKLNGDIIDPNIYLDNLS